GLLSGLAPAFQGGRRSLTSSLRERAGSGGGVRLRKAIVAAQIALSLVLVIGAVLFARTLTGLLAKGPGFDTASLISFGIEPRQPDLVGRRAPPGRVRPGRVEPPVISHSRRAAHGTRHRRLGDLALPAAPRRKLELPDDDTGRSPNRHRSRSPSERGHAGLLFHARRQNRVGA